MIQPQTARDFSPLPATSAVIVSCVRTYARWRLIRWIFESLQKPAVLKKTLSRILHLFYTLCKTSSADMSSADIAGRKSAKILPGTPGRCEYFFNVQ